MEAPSLASLLRPEITPLLQVCVGDDMATLGKLSLVSKDIRRVVKLGLGRFVLVMKGPGDTGVKNTSMWAAGFLKEANLSEFTADLLLSGM